MSLPGYSQYKDSGVPWLGKVPKHWPVHETKRHFLRKKVINTGMACENRLALTMNGVVPRSLDDLDGLQSSDYEGYQLFEKGDLAFKLIDLQNIKTSRVGLVPERGIMSPAYIRLQPLGNTDSRFAYWYFMALYWNQVFNSLGGGVRQTLGPEELLTLEYPAPPLDEQTVIAAFLDRETAKIDALIAEQEKLLTLLAEKRQATISHAVTKGLNPDAPMKNSGVAWLGEVPAHWQLVPFKCCVDYQEGPGILAEDFRDGGVPLLRVAGIQEQWATLTGCNYLDPEKVTKKWQHFRLVRGDLLISASASMGTICEVGEEAEGAIPYTGIIRLRGKDGQMEKSFIRHLVVSSQFLTQIDLLKAGATIQHFGPTHLGQMFVVRPPEEEQRLIATFIDDVLAKLSTLTNEAIYAVQLLKERRSALISAAVTGKIDVRNIIPEPEPA